MNIAAVSEGDVDQAYEVLKKDAIDGGYRLMHAPAALRRVRKRRISILSARVTTGIPILRTTGPAIVPCT